MKRTTAILLVVLAMLLISSMAVYGEDSVRIYMISTKENSETKETDICIYWTPVQDTKVYNIRLLKKDKKTEIKKYVVKSSEVTFTFPDYKDLEYVEIIAAKESGGGITHTCKIDRYEGKILSIEPVVLGAYQTQDNTKLVLNEDLLISKVSVIRIMGKDKEELIQGGDNKTYPLPRSYGDFSLLVSVTTPSGEVMNDVFSGTYMDPAQMGTKESCYLQENLQKELFKSEEEYDTITYWTKNGDILKFEGSFDGQIFFDVLRTDYLNDKRELTRVECYLEGYGWNDGAIKYIRISYNGDSYIDEPYKNGFSFAEHIANDHETVYTLELKNSIAKTIEVTDPYISFDSITISRDTFLEVLVNEKLVYTGLTQGDLGDALIPLADKTNEISFRGYNLAGKTTTASMSVIYKNEEELSTEALLKEELGIVFDRNYNNSLVEINNVTIKGQVFGGNVLKINGTGIVLDKYKRFEISTNLTKGQNVFEFLLLGPNNREYKESLTILYEKPDVIISVDDIQQVERPTKEIPVATPPPTEPEESPEAEDTAGSQTSLFLPPASTPQQKDQDASKNPAPLTTPPPPYTLVDDDTGNSRTITIIFGSIAGIALIAFSIVRRRR